VGNEVRIAITGGIADGKTTVCSMIADLGHKVVSADAVVADLYGDPATAAAVRDQLGQTFVSGGAIDREALRAEITQNPEARKALNVIFHPAVMRRVLEETAVDLAFAEVPLLIETATQGWFDEVWVVSAGIEEQRRRLVERLGNEADADALLSTQLPTEAKIPFADRVVRTNTALDTVKTTLAGHVKELLEGRLRA
jgi:dephospho-CoA kinase